MSSPWKVDPSGLAVPARKFLRHIRRGLSVREAASRAGVSEFEARTWMADGKFRDAYEAARKPGPRPRIINLNNITTGPEDIEPARERISALGYVTDAFGRLVGRQ